jgi:hypothetical protein
MANSFEAFDSAGTKVFMKCYTSPAPASSWYRSYFNHQRDLTKRLADSGVGDYCVRAHALFEARVGGSPEPTLFQAFEFIDGGHDLEHLLRRARAAPETLRWPQRVVMAKVFLAGMKRLRMAGIVHGDLKPANVQMLPTRAGVGFRPLLIDMDYAFFADRRAPWHGKQGYIGTPNYHSPEHLLGGGVIPVLASDVFTSALILYELLGQGHPYISSDTTEYLAKARAGTPPGILFQGRLNDPAAAIAAAQGLRRALAPIARERPEMGELHALFLPLAGIDDTPPPATVYAPPPPAPAATAPAAGFAPAAVRYAPPTHAQVGSGGSSGTTAGQGGAGSSVGSVGSDASGLPPVPPAPRKFAPLPRLRPAQRVPSLVPPAAAAGDKSAPPTIALVLTGDVGSVEVRNTSWVGRDLLARCSPQSVFAEAAQFEARWANGEWLVVPVKGTRNWTVLNGLALERGAPVSDGDQICLASRASFSQALHLRVSLHPI